MRLLDLFCGVGGWSKAFRARGWYCVGVDIGPFEGRYAGHEFLRADVLQLDERFLNSFDAIVASPPCEEFARAWMPWLRMDKNPAPAATTLLRWSVGLVSGRRRAIVECSKFSARHVGGGQLHGSYALWGDVPPVMPRLPQGKERKSGLRPELRAEIPAELAGTVADYFAPRAVAA